MTYRGVPVTPASAQWTLRRNDAASRARLSALDATGAEYQLVGFESTIYLYCDATALVTHVRKDMSAAHHDYSSMMMRSVMWVWALAGTQHHTVHDVSSSASTSNHGERLALPCGHVLQALWHHSTSISSIRILRATSVLLSHPAPTECCTGTVISTQRPLRACKRGSYDSIRHNLARSPTSVDRHQPMLRCCRR